IGFPCGYYPYEHYCRGDVPGIPDNQGAGAGDTTETSKARGCFTRLGAVVRLRDITDGTASTFMVGESRPGQDENLGARNGWIFHVGSAQGSSTPPINYRSDVR